MSLLLAEQFALVAIDPSKGRHSIGSRGLLNATLAGLLVAELAIDGTFWAKEGGARLFRRIDRRPENELLVAAGRVVDRKGPRVKPVLRGMNRGLKNELGCGTWDAAVAGLVAAGLVGHARGRWITVTPMLEHATRKQLVLDLQEAATTAAPLDIRTALLLSMVGPAELHKTVAPAGTSCKHLRRRIDHCLDDTEFVKIGDLVRRVLIEARVRAVVAG